MSERHRCDWIKLNDELYVEYHDREWGVPVHDDRKLFELLVLESAQSGLSWLTVLRKRENFRKAYSNFDPIKVAKYDDKKRSELLKSSVGIIRHKGKISASIELAKVFQKIQNEHKSFSNYLWKFTDGKVIQNNFKTISDVPTQTELSQTISKDLKLKGVKFFGPVTCYAFLQATGIVNDHTNACFRHKQLSNK